MIFQNLPQSSPSDGGTQNNGLSQYLAQILSQRRGSASDQQAMSSLGPMPSGGQAVQPTDPAAGAAAVKEDVSNLQGFSNAMGNSPNSLFGMSMNPGIGASSVAGADVAGAGAGSMGVSQGMSAIIPQLLQYLGSLI